MPGPIILPEPIRLDEFRDGALDIRGVDLTPSLVALNDKLQSVTSVTVTGRDDGAVLGSSDLAVVNTPAPPWTDDTGNMIGWWQTSDGAVIGGVTIDYKITIRAITTMGRELVVDAMQMVTDRRG